MAHNIGRSPLHTGENPSLNLIGHVSRIYLTTMHLNSNSNKKIQKNPENPENMESGKNPDPEFRKFLWLAT